MDAPNTVPLSDQLIESLKPALVFKNFVITLYFILNTPTNIVKGNKLNRHLSRWQVLSGRV
jgi:hypothetical protein